MDLVDISGYGIDLLTVKCQDTQFRKLLAKCYELYFNGKEIDFNTKYVKFDFIDTYNVRTGQSEIDDVEMLVYMYKFNEKHLYDALSSFAVSLDCPLSHDTLNMIVKQSHKIDGVAIKELTINDLL